jgi:hypothetical protein
MVIECYPAPYTRHNISQHSMKLLGIDAVFPTAAERTPHDKLGVVGAMLWVQIRLKIVSLRACRFESGRGHQLMNEQRGQRPAS